MLEMANVQEFWGDKMALDGYTLDHICRFMGETVRLMSSNNSRHVGMGEGALEVRTRVGDNLRDVRNPAVRQFFAVLVRHRQIEEYGEHKMMFFPNEMELDELDISLEAVSQSNCDLHLGEADEYWLPTGIYIYSSGSKVANALTMALNANNRQFYASFIHNTSDRASVQRNFYTAMMLFYSLAQAIRAFNSVPDVALDYAVVDLLADRMLKPTYRFEPGLSTFIDSHSSFSWARLAVEQWQKSPLPAWLGKEAFDAKREEELVAWPKIS